MSRVMEEDRMVDSFVEFFPNARGQFTSWEQYTNGRYVNEGARLDYILVDEALFRSHAVRGPLPPDCTEDTFDAPETALQLATANGRFTPALMGWGRADRCLPAGIRHAVPPPSHRHVLHAPQVQRPHRRHPLPRQHAPHTRRPPHRLRSARGRRHEGHQDHQVAATQRVEGHPELLPTGTQTDPCGQQPKQLCSTSTSTSCSEQRQQEQWQQQWCDRLDGR
mmetsp:Transcript_23600/g.67794  ORF Transcript_23600/g.67794 Transcript_23600/m.67794 type:complete len:222 (+) Transcript_23600:554-1219(+)